jgi:hypothetical protein
VPALGTFAGMAYELSEVELQVLSAVRDEGVPTNDVAVTQRTGFDRDVVREALRALGGDYLDITPRDDDPVSERIEVLDFVGDGGLTRPSTKE